MTIAIHYYMSGTGCLTDWRYVCRSWTSIICLHFCVCQEDVDIGQLSFSAYKTLKKASLPFTEHYQVNLQKYDSKRQVAVKPCFLVPPFGGSPHPFLTWSVCIPCTVHQIKFIVYFEMLEAYCNRFERGNTLRILRTSLRHDIRFFWLTNLLPWNNCRFLGRFCQLSTVVATIYPHYIFVW